MNGSRYYRVRVAGAKYGVGFGCPHHPKWESSRNTPGLEPVSPRPALD